MEPRNRKLFVDQLLDDVRLDDALKQYGAAEPWPGLEARILAGIRAERERASTQRSRWWAALALATAMLLVSTAAFLVSSRRAAIPVSVADHSATPLMSEGDARSGSSDRRPRPSGAFQIVAHASLGRAAKAMPRLEQFPSPLPLSEQEQILASYVEQHPREALLIARAQAGLLIEQQETSPENGTTQDSVEQNP